MAKSKLIVRRSSKKATILVSKRTVEDALRRANALASSWMGQNENDPRFSELQNITDHLSSILKKTPQEMRAEGAMSVEDYFDDAKMPDQANTLKREVNQIAKWHDEGRQQHAQPAQTSPEQQGVGYVPDSATVMSSQEEKVMADKQANGGAFVTDRDDKGEAKAPEKLEVPRLAKKKKKEAEDPAADAALAAPAPVPAPVAEPAPVPAPAPAAAGGGNAIDYIPTETLIKVIGDIQKEDDFAQNRGKQDALIELTQVIKSRPVLPAEQPEAATAAPAPSTAPALADAGAVPPPVTASKTADLGDHAVGDGGTISDGSGASVSIGQGGASSASPKPISTNPTPEKPKVDFGGLSVASSLEDDKTADDYRLHDFKVQDEGIVPTGGLPSADDQANRMHPEESEFEMDSSMEKEAVTPPGISEEMMHKLKSEYPGEPDKAYATAWKIHNQSALKQAAEKFVAEVAKIANANAGGWFSGSGKPMEVDEDGGRTPEIGEAHSMLDYAPAKLERPAVTAPIELNKQAAEMTTTKAVNKAEQLGNDLKKMYLDAKSLTQVNDTRAVREAVEGIFRAADAFDEATKTLNKQDQQEKSEAEAAEIKAKNKKSSFGGLAFAAAE